MLKEKAILLEKESDEKSKIIESQRQQLNIMAKISSSPQTINQYNSCTFNNLTIIATEKTIAEIDKRLGSFLSKMMDGLSVYDFSKGKNQLMIDMKSNIDNIGTEEEKQLMDSFLDSNKEVEFDVFLEHEIDEKSVDDHISNRLDSMKETIDKKINEKLQEISIP